MGDQVGKKLGTAPRGEVGKALFDFLSRNPQALPSSMEGVTRIAAEITGNITYPERPKGPSKERG